MDPRLLIASHRIEFPRRGHKPLARLCLFHSPGSISMPNWREDYE